MSEEILEGPVAPGDMCEVSEETIKDQAMTPEERLERFQKAIEHALDKAGVNHYSPVHAIEYLADEAKRAREEVEKMRELFVAAGLEVAAGKVDHKEPLNNGKLNIERLVAIFFDIAMEQGFSKLEHYLSANKRAGITKGNGVRYSNNDGALAASIWARHYTNRVLQITPADEEALLRARNPPEPSRGLLIAKAEPELSEGIVEELGRALPANEGSEG